MQTVKMSKAQLQAMLDAAGDGDEIEIPTTPAKVAIGSYAGEKQCAQCGLWLVGTQGYVCPQGDCPTFPKAS